ncbi:phosphotriesterase family protein [Xylanimonas ulmi]|uniref:Phosphotriesterase-related protein n=1 Tax=Xylanimonas ulmi TaxID=228973 RepID=A0A4Q7M396_9MICO|nr:phosphotriesterase [Xylanibacterium ulmi]RZS62375.1 phosphotriesterase-related protein [Xylanibacterium ulmi]
MIQSVLGPIDPHSVRGAVLPHEHLAIDLRVEFDSEAVLSDDDTPAVATELADASARFGLALVIDQTARGMGRDIAALRRIATTSGVPVVASTGWYYERFHPAAEPGDDVGRATALLISDLTEGVDGTDVLAGVIGEIGTHGQTPSAPERVSLLAAGRAAAATARPVSTHAHLGTGARAQLDLLASTGVDLSRVSIGHQDLTTDAAQHAAIADAGAYIAFDTIGKESYQPDDVRLRLVLDLLEQGRERNLLLSNDISRRSYLRVAGGKGYSHTLGRFAARLRAAGIDKHTLDQLFRRNALRWLTGVDVDGAAAPIPSPCEEAL